MEDVGEQGVGEAMCRTVGGCGLAAVVQPLAGEGNHAVAGVADDVGGYVGIAQVGGQGDVGVVIGAVPDFGKALDGAVYVDADDVGAGFVAIAVHVFVPEGIGQAAEVIFIASEQIDTRAVEEVEEAAAVGVAQVAHGFGGKVGQAVFLDGLGFGLFGGGDVAEGVAAAMRCGHGNELGYAVASGLIGINPPAGCARGRFRHTALEVFAGFQPAHGVGDEDDAIFARIGSEDFFYAFAQGIALFENGRFVAVGFKKTGRVAAVDDELGVVGVFVPEVLEVDGIDAARLQVVVFVDELYQHVVIIGAFDLIGSPDMRLISSVDDGLKYIGEVAPDADKVGVGIDGLPGEFAARPAVQKDDRIDAILCLKAGEEG